jgi:hypothetical protein
LNADVINNNTISVGVMDEDDDDESAPLVSVGTDRIPISQVTEHVVAKMTSAEKEAYVQQYQDFYSQD